MRGTLAMRAGVIAVAAALLAACGSDDSGGSGGGGGDAGEPQSGGSASIIQFSEPRTLDPAIMGNLAATNALVGNSLFGQLLRVDTEGEVEYGLAEDLSTSDGGTTWKLVLRDGLTFSDGTPFDAAAVAYNWERIKDPATGSRTAGYAVLIDTMTPSGQTLDFTLTQPIPLYHETISSQPMNWIASPQALQAGAAAFDENPIGAGPFVLDSWQRSGEMVLARNDSYYDSPRPYLDELVLTVNPDATQRFGTLTSGGADGAVSTSPEQLALATGGGAESVIHPTGDSLVEVMNARIAPFDDVRARQAVFLGVDRDAVNAAAFQGEGDVPETLFKDDSPYNGDTTLPEYDQEAAQELFDELADDGKPVQFTITTLSNTETRRVAEAIQAQLNQYDNVDVELEVLDQSASFAKYSARTFQMTNGLLRTADVDLYSFLNSESESNVSGVSDPELDAALEEGLSAADQDARADAYAQVAERYSELVPALNYARPQYALAYDGDRLHGVEMYGNSSIRTDTLWVTG